MASRSALLALLVAVSCAAAASAATFNVGDTQGWAIGGDYATWASSKNFSVGDKLVFNYATGSHDVLVVSKSDYDACNTGSALSSNTNGPTTITLDSAGDHYYICGIGTHCSSGGMKLAVNVGSGSGGSPSPSTPSTPGTPATPTPTTPAGPSPNAAPARFTAAAPALAVAAGVLLKLALF